jgi:hypothetical protein
MHAVTSTLFGHLMIGQNTISSPSNGKWNGVRLELRVRVRGRAMVGDRVRDRVRVALGLG